MNQTITKKKIQIPGCISDHFQSISRPGIIGLNGAQFLCRNSSGKSLKRYFIIIQHTD